MEQNQRECEFYEKSNGHCPTADFLDGLTQRDLVFVDKALERLEKHGQDLGRPYVGYLRDHIWELRVRTQTGRYRLLYFRDDRKFIIMHGIKKKAHKVPDSEIDRAIKYRHEYLERHKKSL
ncbi:MAG: type II toxin-antitoxin system RelE/ParE family toxin [Chloroflexi bacterium]|nr:type II toxin-antitoxin system RelE/ParE family toxin [Chloroflexota bacterium]MBU1662002.1 type II toxin-antitoxin system RelE/ParE family toxin [Chloroflexota bacterium]